MFGFHWYKVCAGQPTLLSMEDFPAPDREAAKRIVMALFEDEAPFRGADRVTLHENRAQDFFWEHRA
jgi:hypothetical protein